ncbi:MAG: glycosyltransferase family 87 protein [Minicystis sp.]
MVFVIAGAAGVARATGRGAALILGGLLALGIGAAAFTRARRLLPGAIDGAARRRPVVSGSFALSVLLAFVQIGRLGAFMADPANRWGSVFPSPSATDHMCLSAYVHAADLARRGDPNVYEARHYPIFTDPPRAAGEPPPIHDSPVEHLGPWMQDPYEYPPPFLLLPRLALSLTNDFHVLRPAWFAVHGVAILFLVLSIARFIGGPAGLRVGLFTPILFASVPFVIILQWGQAHLLVIGAAVAGMAAFARGKTAIGAGLLGTAVMIKIFPGLLVVHLILKGRRREALATVGACAAICILALLVLGPAPFQTFAGYQLPRMASGEAFSFFQRGWLYVSRNISIMGIPFRLRELGLGGGLTAAASKIGWLYTLALIGLTVRVSRRSLDRLGEVSVWLGLLVLGSLRSPLSPNVYIVAPVLWLLALRPTRGAASVAALVLTWFVVMGPPPLPIAVVELTALLIVQLTVIFLAVRGVVRPPVAA